MKRLMLVFVLMLCLPLAAQAAAPLTVNYQGVLTDSGGVPLNSSISMELRVYDAAAAGTLLYSESHAGVTVSNGLFSLALGGGTPITGSFDASLFSAAGRWLEVVVNGETQSPRQAFLSVPFALQSEQAANAATLEGNAASAFVLAADLTSQVAALQSQIDALSGSLTTVQGDVSTVQSGLATAQGDISTLQGDVSTNTGNIASNAGAIIVNAGNISSNAGSISTNTSGISSNASAISGLQDKTQFVSVAGTEMTITGANLNIRSGSGATNGTINGLGNLVIGYNENSSDARTGSHNLIVGPYHSYSSYGGLLAGYNNMVSGVYSGVSGGTGNTASGQYASVSGGISNSASGQYASVSGGFANVANSQYASVSGGNGNTASGQSSSISGGQYNVASGTYASVGGGIWNKATGAYATVVGGGNNGGAGDGNEAYANYSVVVGGYQNRTGDGVDPYVAQSSAILAGIGGSTTGTAGTTLDGNLDAAISANASNISSNASAIGGLQTKTQFISVSGTEMYITGANLNIRSGSGSTSGAINGKGNLVIGYNENYTDTRTGSHNLVVGPFHSYRSYGGLLAGYDNETRGAYASVSGGSNNYAIGQYASVSGGYINNADGDYASVSGGRSNTASGQYTSISGGNAGHASGQYASISGGLANTASGDGASVSGGWQNTAGGTASTVSGGNGNTASASATYASISGDSGISSNASAITALQAKTQYVSVSGTEMYITGANLNIRSGSGSTAGTINGKGNLVIGYNENSSDSRTGSHNLVVGPYHSYSSYGGQVAGYNNTISGLYSSVNGGDNNSATATYATVGGGHARSATGQYNWTAGTYSAPY